MYGSDASNTGERMTNPLLRLRWERTYDDRGGDFTVFDGPTRVGRVIKDVTGNAGWFWTLSGAQGFERTQFSAWRSLEAEYFATDIGTKREVTQI